MSFANTALRRLNNKLGEPMNRKYESIAIFNPTLSEAAIKDEIKKFEKFLETNSAKNIQVDNWGRKQIAYAVEKQSYGTFVCFKFESENHEIVNQLNAIFRITDNVIKYQSHKIIEKVRKFKGNPKRKTPIHSDEDFGDSAMADY